MNRIEESGSILIVVSLILYIILASAFVALYVQEHENKNIQSISFSLPENEHRAEIDLTSSDGDNLVKNYTRRSVLSGDWIFNENIGLIAHSNMINEVAFTNIEPMNGNYTVTYYLNNSPMQPFKIFVKNGLGAFTNNYVYTVDNAGIHMASEFLGLELPFISSFSYANPNLLKEQYFTVTTNFNDNEDSPYCDFYVNNVKLFTHYDMPKSGELTFSGYFYGGIQASKDFTIEKVITNFVKTEDSSVFSQTTNFFAILAQVIVWTDEGNVFPFLMNLIFIKLAIFALIGYGIVTFLGR